MSEPIVDRMKDCGDGHHIGWWTEKAGLADQSILIEVKPHTVMISCCEGERAEKRISFITSHEKAIEITRALANALGISREIRHPPGWPMRAGDAVTP